MSEGDVDERRFRVATVVALGLAAATRLAFLWTDDRPLIGGDGFIYMLDAQHLADGRGFPWPFHPPGWVTVLGLYVKLAGRSLLTVQVLGAAIGILVVLLTGLVARLYLGPRAGTWAVVIAAVYPGYWALEANVLSEPLALLVLGVVLLGAYRLWARPTVGLAVLMGVGVGLVSLVRAESLLLMAFVVAPVLLRASTLGFRRRLLLLAGSALACVLVLAPWVVYNESRFKTPVLISSNTGGLLLSGNCAPSTYEGELLGWYDQRCQLAQMFAHPGLDASEIDRVYGRVAIENIGDNLGALPTTIPARFGRMLAVFRPAQTVQLAAAWLGSETWVVWAWVASYWAILSAAVVGVWWARRNGRFILPLVAPFVIVVVVVAVAYGEPRYHSAADLPTIALAGAGCDALWRRMRRGMHA